MQDARTKLIAACQEVICSADDFREVSVRRIVAVAGTNLGAINYHFGSMEGLVAETTKLVYRRINAERLDALQRARDRASPYPPEIDEVLAALVGPSIRWSLDPASAYPVMLFFHRLSVMSHHPDQYRPVIETVEHHRVFIRCLAEIAPWFDEVEIGFRLSCALGVRTQITRQRERTAVLTRNAMDLDDPEALIRETVAAIAPMFAPPTLDAAIRTTFEKRREQATKPA